MAKKSPHKQDGKGRSSPGGKTSAGVRPKLRQPSGAKSEVAVSECAVVGLGASAGGLDAFRKFFSAMPDDCNMAFVLVQHLDPTHESLMVELLSRVTPLKVVQIADGMDVEANHVYMIPPNRTLMIRHGKLHLIEPIERRGMRMPIDIFFRSLAEDQQERAIGIILSGTGTEGTLGLKAIKASCGLTIAQDPDSAHYDGMPRSAIAAGVVDQVLPVEGMPAVLLDYVRYWGIHYKTGSRPQEEGTSDYLEAVLALLRSRVKYEFSSYKRSTLVRRIQRRMILKHIEQGSDYLALLRDNPEETSALFKDLLISVSGFFREPEAWGILEEKAIKPVMLQRKQHTAIRVWVPGCATGEEAYSIAMVVLEQLQETKQDGNIQIFATDIDEDALARARAGSYPASIAAEVRPDRLSRFFNSTDDGYTVSKLLRDSVMFAVQNVIADVPFSKLDLISCRNLLIYLEPEVQKKLIALFHFALRDDGVLFLGNAETLGQNEDLFEPLSKKWRIYRRSRRARPYKIDFPLVPAREPHRELERSPRFGAVHGATFAETAQRMLLEIYVPACVLVNDKYEVLHYQGSTHNYLAQPTGPPTMDLLACIRGGLRAKLRGALHRATQSGEPTTLTEARVPRGGGSRLARITVTPLRAPKEVEGLLLVAFEDQPGLEPPPGLESPSPDDALMRALEDDLKATKEDLQGSIEQLESANEELKTANEEVMSVNEELQSINEELETSKEELQSLNEELTTVNNQLEGKIAELEAANDDLNNLLKSTSIATIFLDSQYRIRRFTPAATTLFSLIPADAGRPLSDISPKFTDSDLLSDAEAVLGKFTPIEREVQTQDGRWYLRRALPYRTDDERVVGVVVTFSEITERKRAAEDLQRINADLEHRVHQRTVELETLNDQLRQEITERQRAELGLREREARIRALVDTAADAIITIDGKGRVESFNPAAEIMFKCKSDKIIGHYIRTLMPKLQWVRRGDQIRRPSDSDDKELIGILREVVGRSQDGATFPIDLVISEIKIEDRRTFTLIARNLSERRALEKEVLEASTREQQRISRDLHDRVGQELTGIGYLATSLAQELGSRPPGAAATKIAQGIQRVVGEVRSAIRGLTPVAIEDNGLMTALEELASRTREHFDIPCRFVCNRVVSIDDNRIATHLYFIAQEAVHNAVKHARAKEIVVALRGAANHVSLEISDDGVGIAPQVELGQRMGLHIMRYRASEIGAALALGSVDGAGTRVTCTLPRGAIHA